jgi:acetyl-CoA acetyltransferase family protein
MQQLPLGAELDLSPRLHARMAPESMRLGCTAEWLARRLGIARTDQDAFAARSHRRASAAYARGQWTGEVLPTRGLDAAGLPAVFDRDQGVRAEIRLDQLARLPPVFQPRGGTVTAGNSSPQSVGAAALLVLSEARARQLGLEPLARVVATAAVGVAPSAMGLAPVAAARRALQRAGWTPGDVDLWEINESFAAQCLACVRQLDLDESRVNIRGGAIALGHPLGASGARIAVTLVHALRDTGARRGMAALCIGMGQGIATAVERL